MPLLVSGDTRRFLYLVRKLVNNSVRRTETATNNTIKINLYYSEGLTNWNQTNQEVVSLLEEKDEC
jgi:hypothetical protein